MTAFRILNEIFQPVIILAESGQLIQANVPFWECRGIMFFSKSKILLSDQLSQHSLGAVNLSLQSFFVFSCFSCNFTDGQFIIIVVKSCFLIRRRKLQAAVVKFLLQFFFKGLSLGRGTAVRKCGKIQVFCGNRPAACPFKIINTLLVQSGTARLFRSARQTLSYDGRRRETCPGLNLLHRIGRL